MTSTTPADRTPQEQLWAGEFGNDYIARNRAGALLDNNRALFEKILAHTPDVTSAIEFGANIGNNLRALRELLPAAELHSVEINAQAAAEIAAWGGATVQVASLMDFEPTRLWDLSFTKGVLIHLPPESLPGVYDKLVAASSRYVMVCEYYNPSPVEVSYRGHEHALFKRDFAGEILDAHPELR
ncbi:MAG: pseudaminic acid biosynthesis-associated methylase, partial [Actinomycetota bacterium]